MPPLHLFIAMCWIYLFICDPIEVKVKVVHSRCRLPEQPVISPCCEAQTAAEQQRAAMLLTEECRRPIYKCEWAGLAALWSAGGGAGWREHKLSFLYKKTLRPKTFSSYLHPTAVHISAKFWWRYTARGHECLHLNVSKNVFCISKRPVCFSTLWVQWSRHRGLGRWAESRWTPGGDLQEKLKAFGIWILAVNWFKVELT